MEKNEMIKWLLENRVLLNTNYKINKDEMALLYKVYNLITGENKSFTGCSKCLYNVKKRLVKEIALYEDKLLRYIYRKDGELTLEKSDEIAFSFWVKDVDDLVNRFTILKDNEKNIKI